MAEKKDWYMSKTFWGAVCVFVGGGLNAVGLEMFGGPLMAIGLGLGFIGIRTAKADLK